MADVAAWSEDVVRARRARRRGIVRQLMEGRSTMKATDLKRGDKCPNCGGELKPARVPTAEEHRKAFDRENPIALPPSMDTASPDQRAELGELFICEHNDYRVRFAPEKPAGQARGDQAGA